VPIDVQDEGATGVQPVNIDADSHVLEPPTLWAGTSTRATGTALRSPSPTPTGPVVSASKGSRSHPAERLGATHVMRASDYPHIDGFFPGATEEIAAQLPDDIRSTMMVDSASLFSRVRRAPPARARHTGHMVVTCPDCDKKNRVPAVATGRPRCANCHHDLPWIADATDADFAAVVEQSPLPAVVDLWAPWCGPCRMISPALEEVATDLRGRMKLVKVNVDENPGTSQRFRVQGIPMLLVFRDGALVDQSMGAQGATQLRAWIGPLVSS
jgi:thioredoxin 2